METKEQIEQMLIWLPPLAGGKTLEYYGDQIGRWLDVDHTKELMEAIREGYEIRIKEEPVEQNDLQLKQSIINTVDDLVTDFLFYDRKEDEELELGAIEMAIDKKVITREEIITRFADQLNDGLEDNTKAI